jgi:hypothetical protein
MYSGPTATFTVGYNKEFPEAVSSSTGTSNTDTKSKGVAFQQQVTPGFQYNGKNQSAKYVLRMYANELCPGWWAPTLSCQMWTLSCDQGEGPVEKCEPLLDANRGPVGEHGIMTSGRA